MGSPTMTIRHDRRVGEVGELVEFVGGEHPRFVDDDGGSGGEVVAMRRGSGEVMFGEEFVDRVGIDPGLRAQYFGGGGGGCDTEHGPPLRMKLLDPGGEGRGLPGPGRADHQRQMGVPGDGGGDLGLRAGELDPGPTSSDGRVDGGVGHPPVGPRVEPVFLRQDRVGGEGTVDAGFGDRPAITPQRNVGGDGTRDVDTAGVDGELW